MQRILVDRHFKIRSNLKNALHFPITSIFDVFTPSNILIVVKSVKSHYDHGYYDILALIQKVLIKKILYRQIKCFIKA